MLKRPEKHRCDIKTLGILDCDLGTFLRFLKEFTIENRLQNLNRVTDCSQKNFLK